MIIDFFLLFDSNFILMNHLAFHLNILLETKKWIDKWTKRKEFHSFASIYRIILLLYSFYTHTHRLQMIEYIFNPQLDEFYAILFIFFSISSHLRRGNPIKNKTWNRIDVYSISGITYKKKLWNPNFFMYTVCIYIYPVSV